MAKELKKETVDNTVFIATSSKTKWGIALRRGSLLAQVFDDLGEDDLRDKAMSLWREASDRFEDAIAE